MSRIADPAAPGVAGEFGAAHGRLSTDAASVKNPAMDDSTPDWLADARSKWTNRGQQRPPFAIDPGPGEESVWDYPRPPAMVPDTRRVVVSGNDGVIADTTSAIRILETASPPTFYLPPDDVDLDKLVMTAGSSFCEWKGPARYWALPEDPDRPVGWDYPEPLPGSELIQHHVAFYPGRVACTIDTEPVRPQAGEFYGGWITDEVKGPFKGDPGTSSW